MKFIDLAAQQTRIRADVEQRLKAVLDHGCYVMGPEIEELEAALAARAGMAAAVACGSGTDALLLALMAKGVGDSDAVFLPSFTFIATAGVVRLLGAVPIFVDIRPDTFNMDPAALAHAVQTLSGRSEGKRPVGIITVDLFGQPADHEAIQAVADTSGLWVIEDAAQSFGAAWNGKPAGGLAETACVSFFPAKPLGGYGDGGAVFLKDGKTADIIRSLRSHGQGGHRYTHDRIGINGRMDSFQAAVLLSKLEIFDDELRRRRTAAAGYTERLKDVDGLRTPVIRQEAESAWAQYSLAADSASLRDRMRTALSAEGIPTAIYYPVPLHLQPAFGDLGHAPGDLPVSEDMARRIFSLPLHPYLEPADQDRIRDILSAIR